MAAGLGTRMHSATPKHLHPLLGRRMVDWVLDAVAALRPDPLVVVCSPATRDAFDGAVVAVQEEPLGTGDAIVAAREALERFDGDVLVVAGDSPLLQTRLLERLVEEHRRNDAAVTVTTFEPTASLPYGRIVRGTDGELEAIVEAGDATPEQLAIRELNASIYVFSASALWPALERLDADNEKGELYLTDTVRHIVEAGGKAATYLSDDSASVVGVNTRAELAAAAAALRERVNEQHMLAGVTIVDPVTAWIDADVELEPDAVIHPFTVLRGRTRVAAGAEVGPHVVAVDATIGRNCPVGPFCYLRPGTVLEDGAKAGTFVEIKNSRIGAGAKVPHLSYIGDTEIGEETNIGAGAITANYRPEIGSEKQRTRIGRNVHTGVHNSFVAPVEIGDDAWIGAGSVITKDVPPGALGVARARQINKEGYARGRERDD
jgi:bifunctional UDP-N-acetylglucosamine pyrophosphorylase/glucosamine-1-phosphate N-acetyltransferase